MGEPLAGPFAARMSEIRELVLGATKYALGGVLAHAIRLVTLPIYLRFLSASEYGIQAIALLSESLLLIVTGYAMTNALGRHLYGERSDPDRHGIVVGTAVAAVTVLGIVTAVAWQALAEPLSEIILDGSATSVVVVRLVGLSFFFGLYFDLALTLAQLRQEIARYSALNIGRFVLSAILSVALLWARSGVVGLILGWTIASAATGLYSLIWLWRAYRLRTDATVARRLAGYGAPLVPAALLALALNGSDRYVLKLFSGLEVVGVYSTAFLLASACNFLLITPFRQAWPAVMWRMRGRSDEAAMHRSLLRYYVAVQVFLLLAISVFSGPAMRLVSSGAPAFMDAALAVPILYGGFALFGAYEILSAGYFFAGRTAFYTATVALSSAANVGLNLALVPFLGLWGSAVAFLLSYLFYAGLSGAFGSRYFDPGHDWRPIAAGMGLGLIAIGAYVASLPAGPVAALVVGVLALAVLPILMTRARLVATHEILGGAVAIGKALAERRRA